MADSEPAGAVCIQVGRKYITLGSVPEAGSLTIQRIEKIPQSWVDLELAVGDTLAFPLEEQQPLVETYYPEEYVREYLTEFAEEEGFNHFRSEAADRGITAGQNPTLEDLIEAHIEVGAYVGKLSRHNPGEEEEVSYGLLELYQGIEEAAGPASEQALAILDGQVSRLQTKLEVAEDYQSIPDEESQFDRVQDVADEHGISWRTVHRYVADVLPEEDRIEA